VFPGLLRPVHGHDQSGPGGSGHLRGCSLSENRDTNSLVSEESLRDLCRFRVNNWTACEAVWVSLEMQGSDVCLDHFLQRDQERFPADKHSVVEQFRVENSLLESWRERASDAWVFLCLCLCRKQPSADSSPWKPRPWQPFRLLSTRRP
jgi:hypothetical protein